MQEVVYSQFRRLGRTVSSLYYLYLVSTNLLDITTSTRLELLRLLSC